ncbi:MAG TPA: alanine--tRNA ligase, partial [Thermoleophilia bacterium]|nr:alanine--tRNA ligase [Thermoleophilia bacterium]
MKTRDLRKLFLDYFVENGHLLMPSASLVPYRDPSVLLTTAGMQQFKPYFLGMAEAPATRMTSAQKCFRTTDIDRVGFTARHCTFFEMLGNFSVGDYFKEGAIRFGYELSTERLGLDPARIWVSVFEGDAQVEADEEAMRQWEQVGIPRERMVALPRSENFWGPPGPTGPCGPCSELYYDRGSDRGCGSPDCRPGCDCDRFLEYWNLVFMQYNMDDQGRLTPLPSRNIDTGMGLERIAALMQGVDSVFLTDSFYPLIQLGEEISGLAYGGSERADAALRVLADHSRSMSFLIADGVLPGNEGRGYVLRRIIRRAARFSRNLEMTPPFLGRFAERTIELLADAYPELHERRETIMRIVNSEEERFNRTLDQGLVLLDEEIRRARGGGTKMFSGAAAFVLHDTFGFPVEVTREIVEEKGLSLDLDGFDAAMEGQRARARATSKELDSLHEAAVHLARESQNATEFVGYAQDEVFTVIDSLQEFEDGDVVLTLRESPFYAEGGGQTADIGWIETDAGRAEVRDVQHHGAVQVIVAHTTAGSLEQGVRAKAVISSAHRHSVAANHTGTHLLHHALRSTLGKDVTQAGSSVRADKFRFDFAFHEPLGSDRLTEIEEIVNRKIVENHPVRAFTTSLDHARDLGATALFGEKYGDFVRVVEIDDFSRELCGGTHVHSTSEIGIFKILSEGSVGANVRRIEAVTGRRAVEYYRSQDSTVSAAAGMLAVQEDALLPAVNKLQTRVAGLTREVGQLLAAKAGDLTSAVVEAAIEADGVKVAVAQVDARDNDHLLALLDQVRDRLAPAIVLLATVSAGKVTSAAAVSNGVDGSDA